VFGRLRERAGSPVAAVDAQSCDAAVPDDDDALLERLIDLETRLEEDLARKEKHQKPQLQAQWRDEIARLRLLL